MRKPISLQRDYTICGETYQLSLPLNLEKIIPSDDSVRLVDLILDQMELEALFRSYARKVPANEVNPRQMLKIVLYAHMNGIYSTRKIESSCKRDINFMWLLEGTPAPDHATIARFISLHFASCEKEIMAEFTSLLYQMGEITGQDVFIDGTKIESCANKYTFVWKKAVNKRLATLLEKLAVFVEECENAYGLQIVHGDKVRLHDLKKLYKAFMKLKKQEGIEFVHGPGHSKTPLQRSVETLAAYRERLKTYTQDLYHMGERNSYSKTDHDATFMRMKEDYMRNGQLKPGYNVQHAVDSEYITWVTISGHPTDTKTLIPTLQEMDRYLPFKYRNIVADSGYESEENYSFLEKTERKAYLKPVNYEISKSRKYKTDISRMENMTYDPEKDVYICHNQKELSKTGEYRSKSDTGYVRTVSVYTCQECKGCPYRSKCIKGNNWKIPEEERYKKLTVSQKLQEYRQEDLKNILSDKGTQLRMNRSIQAEGSFAETKEDMGFRRYLYRGKNNVLAESILIALARNMNKLHAKVQGGRLQQHLFELKESA